MWWSWLPLLGSDLKWPILSSAQELESCQASLCVLLTLSEACPTVFGWTVSFHQSSCDVSSADHHFSWSRIPGRSCDHLQRSLVQAIAFDLRRTGHAKTAQVSNPMMCSSLRSDFTSQIAVRQRSSSFVRSAVLGTLYPIVSQNIAMPAVYSRPCSLEYPVPPSALTA